MFICRISTSIASCKGDSVGHVPRNISSPLRVDAWIEELRTRTRFLSILFNQWKGITVHTD